jgi:hypothetical protein
MSSALVLPSKENSGSAQLCRPAKKSPVHGMTNALVDALCLAATEASRAEKALRVSDHRTAQKALQKVCAQLQAAGPAAQVALWESTNRSSRAKNRKLLLAAADASAAAEAPAGDQSKRPQPFISRS